MFIIVEKLTFVLVHKKFFFAVLYDKMSQNNKQKIKCLFCNFVFKTYEDINKKQTFQHELIHIQVKLSKFGTYNQCT